MRGGIASAKSWINLTGFDVARIILVRKQQLEDRYVHFPLFDWNSERQAQPPQRAAVRRAYGLTPSRNLDSLECMPMYDVASDYVIDNQCTLGQHHRESGMLMLGRTR